MSAIAYHDAITKVLDEIRRTQIGKIQEAGEAIATSIAGGGFCWLFGSGHSVIPVMDVFPRYGSFVGFVPLYDPRLMWSNVVGPGGARELLWIERKEGYAPVFLQSYPLAKGDTFVVFSHGGLNAAPIEAALYAKARGLTVVTVSSLRNAAVATATHSSGKQLSDVADVAIDNCVAPRTRRSTWPTGEGRGGLHDGRGLRRDDARRRDGRPARAKGHVPTTFVSPNVPGVEPGHNMRVFEAYARRLAGRGAP